MKLSNEIITKIKEGRRYIGAMDLSNHDPYTISPNYIVTDKKECYELDFYTVRKTKGDGYTPMRGDRIFSLVIERYTGKVFENGLKSRLNRS